MSSLEYLVVEDNLLAADSIPEKVTSFPFIVYGSEI